MRERLAIAAVFLSCVATWPRPAQAMCHEVTPVPAPDDCLDRSPIAARFRVAFLEDQVSCNDQLVPFCGDPLPNFALWYGHKAVAFYRSVIDRCLKSGDRRNPQNASVMYSAANGLRYLREPAAVDALLRLYEGSHLWDKADPPARIRTALLRAETLRAIAASVPKATRGEFLGRHLLSDQDMQSSVLTLLTDEPEESARPYLLRFLKTAQGDVRQSAEDVLHRLDHPDDCVLTGWTGDSPRECTYQAPHHQPASTHSEICPRYFACPKRTKPTFGDMLFSPEACPHPYEPHATVSEPLNR